MLRKDLPSVMVWHAEVANNPPELHFRVDLIIPDFSGNKRWRNCRWQARDDVSLPRRGDKCVVVFSNRGEPWVIAWWPFDV